MRAEGTSIIHERIKIARIREWRDSFPVKCLLKIDRSKQNNNNRLWSLNV